MSIYKKFCTEIFDENGNLKRFSLHYPENFNFAYDVVDELAEKTPEKKLSYGATRKMKSVSLPSLISADTAVRWQTYFSAPESAGETAFSSF